MIASKYIRTLCFIIALCAVLVFLNIYFLAPRFFHTIQIYPLSNSYESLNLSTTPFSVRSLAEYSNPVGYVAHGLGTIDGTAYTNSAEAFQESYNKGFRIFETDLSMLKDGNVIAAHDGIEGQFYSLNRKFSQLTIKEVEGKKFNGQYTLLSGRDLIELLVEHRDVYFILDTKLENVPIVKEMVNLANVYEPEVLDRMIPLVGTGKEIDEIREIYSFPNFQLKLSRVSPDILGSDEAIIQFIVDNRISSIMMWQRDRNPRKSIRVNNKYERMFSESFFSKLKKVGIPTFVHGLPPDDIQRMRYFRELGVGIYSRGIFANQL